MAGPFDYNLQLQSDFTQQEYAPPLTTGITAITGAPTGGAITTISGNSGAGASGPTVTFSGGTTGLTTVAAGTSITLSGTLVVANGGTNATTAAGARTNLSVPLIHTAAVAPAVTDDGASGFLIGALWVDTVLDNAFISVDDSSGAAIWKQIT